jgi:hypothetical protein
VAESPSAVCHSPATFDELLDPPVELAPAPVAPPQAPVLATNVPTPPLLCVYDPDIEVPSDEYVPVPEPPSLVVSVTEVPEAVPLSFAPVVAWMLDGYVTPLAAPLAETTSVSHPYSLLAVEAYDPQKALGAAPLEDVPAPVNEPVVFCVVKVPDNWPPVTDPLSVKSPPLIWSVPLEASKVPVSFVLMPSTVLTVPVADVGAMLAAVSELGARSADDASASENPPLVRAVTNAPTYVVVDVGTGVDAVPGSPLEPHPATAARAVTAHQRFIKGRRMRTPGFEGGVSNTDRRETGAAI